MKEFANRLNYTMNIQDDINVIEIFLGDNEEEIISNFVSCILDQQQLLFLNNFTYQIIQELSDEEFDNEIKRILKKCFRDYLKFNLTSNQTSNFTSAIKSDGLPGEIFVSNIISKEAGYNNIIPKIAMNYKKGGFTGIDVVANNTDSYVFSEVKYAKRPIDCYGGLKEDLESLIAKRLKAELELVIDNDLHNKRGFTFEEIEIEESDTIQFADIIRNKLDKNTKIILWGITEKRFEDSKHHIDLQRLVSYLQETVDEYNDLSDKLSVFYIHVPIISKDMVARHLLQNLKGVYNGK